MFKDTKAFSSFSVDDVQKAKKFYGQTLGLEVSESYGGRSLEIHIAGWRNIVIYPKDNHTPATSTSPIVLSRTAYQGENKKTVRNFFSLKRDRDRSNDCCQGCGNGMELNKIDIHDSPSRYIVK